MRKSLTGAMRRGALLATLTFVLVGLISSPAHAWTQKPGETHCKNFNFKDLTADLVVENASVKLADDKGNLLAADVAASVLINANLVVCVTANAEAEVDIALGGILDDDKNGKKDTILVNIDVLAKADAKAHIHAKIKGQIGATVSVAAHVDIDLDVKGGEKKSTKCKGKDGVDSY